MTGRPRLIRTHIVDPIEVINDAAMRAETWIMRTLCQATNDVFTTMEFLAKRSLLKNSQLCNNCNVHCMLAAYTQGIDKKMWKCPTCGLRKSIRDGSFFTGSHLPLSKIVILIYCFANDFPQDQVKYEAEIQNQNTVIDWFNFIREEIDIHLTQQATMIGGFDANGEPTIVEVDESKYFHRKYHRGALRQGHWVVGGIERDSGKCFLVEVQDRTAATLENIIIQHVLPGTHIITDGWAGYRNLDQWANGIFLHSVVVHERNFVDPDDPTIHTQNIENLWMRAKRKLKRQFGTSADLFPSYLKEFQYRCNFPKTQVFNEILIVLKGRYPV